MHYNVAVPAGIGDVSWIWSKLSTIKDATFTIYTPDTWPQRTFDWLKLLGPKVIPALGKHGYNDILMRENMYGYSDYSSWKEPGPISPAKRFLVLAENRGEALKPFPKIKILLFMIK